MTRRHTRIMREYVYDLERFGHHVRSCAAVKAEGQLKYQLGDLEPCTCELGKRIRELLRVNW